MNEKRGKPTAGKEHTRCCNYKAKSIIMMLRYDHNDGAITNLFRRILRYACHVCTFFYDEYKLNHLLNASALEFLKRFKKIRFQAEFHSVSFEAPVLIMPTLSRSNTHNLEV